MQNDPKEILRRRMLEASMLPPDDPLRSELEAELAAEGDWARGEWLELLEENERIRLELLNVRVPEKLAGGLMQISAGSGTGFAARTFASPVLRIAATVLLMIGFGGGALFFMRDNARTDRQIELIAELALESYVHDHDVSVITLDPGYLERNLEGTVPFQVKMPVVQSDLSLIGGRSSSLGAYPAVYTRWSHQAGQQSRCAIIQFRSKDFGLPESAAKEVVQSSNVNCPSTLDKDCNVVVWSEGGNGYALVADSACAMHCLGSR
ncbi:MAG: hypothetical protein FVQ81_17630 [Candidatus Glassbacteria bacterium]|nr:hypothetical protein [Candidatus Glassbacteria bacterium]